jgi:hypothetical protein
MTMPYTLFGANLDWRSSPIEEFLQHVRQALSNDQFLVMRLLLQPEPSDHTDIPSLHYRLAQLCEVTLYAWRK